MRRPWEALPFAGASIEDKEKVTSGKAPRPVDHYGAPGDIDGDGVISRSEATMMFRQMNEEDIVQDYNAPIHMWVIATLFPLAAGTFGPMASMFNICAIAIPWRVIAEPGNAEAEGKHILDPHWLVGVNVLSLVVALIANASLLGQMTNRIPFNISAPITIVGWYISGLIDIALTAAVPQHLPLPFDNPNATYSQAFYYGAFAGAIYFILGIMLTVTAGGVWIGKWSNSYKLSLSQRSLMMQTCMFLAYVLISGAIYSHIENWPYLDANYFVVVTLFTIGFGDFTPKTHLGRGLFFPFAVGGILYVGVIIANIRTLVLESGSVKVSTRMVEKARHQAIMSGRPHERLVKLRGVHPRDYNAPTELERREKEFEIMREIQAQAATNSRIFSLVFSLTAFVILWFIGGVVFWKAESDVGGQNWTYYESIYFTFVAQLTIGYGDFEPQTNAAKPAFVFWSLIALPTLTVLIGAIGDIISDFVNWYTVWIGSHATDIATMMEAMFKRKPKAAEDAKQNVTKDNSGVNEGFNSISNLERTPTIPQQLNVDGLSESQMDFAEKAYRPFIMLQAAQKIVDHLESDQPRKYTYKEWTWLLRLLGEDEADEEGHRTIGMEVPEGKQVVTPYREEPHHVWSWMGQESPLMSLENGSEPKWVLKKLLRVLEKELKEMADRHLEEHVGSPIAEKQSLSNDESEKS